MDIVDIAQSLETFIRYTALESRKRYIGDSYLCCIDCNEHIPILRQQALPGVQLCIDCQQLVEKKCKN